MDDGETEFLRQVRSQTEFGNESEGRSASVFEPLADLLRRRPAQGAERLRVGFALAVTSGWSPFRRNVAAIIVSLAEQAAETDQANQADPTVIMMVAVVVGCRGNGALGRRGLGGSRDRRERKPGTHGRQQT